MQRIRLDRDLSDSIHGSMILLVDCVCAQDKKLTAHDSSDSPAPPKKRACNPRRLHWRGRVRGDDTRLFVLFVLCNVFSLSSVSMRSRKCAGNLITGKMFMSDF